MAPKTVVIVHGWSDDSKSFADLRAFLAKNLGTGSRLNDIRLADWVSMDDEVTFPDLIVAFQNAWKHANIPTSPRSVDVIVHSTGALVVRDWMTTYFSDPAVVPIHRFLMLAPANYGSHLAHKGRAFVGRVFKGWGHGFQTGAKLLHGLELGSAYTWNLAKRDVWSLNPWYGENRILATVLVGNTGYGGIKSIANEAGSDGVVRCATANLDATYLKADFSTKGRESYIREKSNLDRAPLAAFGIMDGENHNTLIKPPQFQSKATGEFILRALKVDDAGWKLWQDELMRHTQSLSPSDSTHPETNPHQHTVVRVIDDLGQPVPEYFIEFYQSRGDRKDYIAEQIHTHAIKHVHSWSMDSSYRALHIDTDEMAKLAKLRLAKTKGAELEISLLAEPEFPARNRNVGYRPLIGKNEASIKIKYEDLGHFFAPNRSLFVTIVVKREISEKVVQIHGQN